MCPFYKLFKIKVHHFSVPAPEHKKPTDYVQGLFRVDVTSKSRPTNSPFRSKNNTPSSTPPPTLTISTSTTSTSTAFSKLRYCK